MQCFDISATKLENESQLICEILPPNVSVELNMF